MATERSPGWKLFFAGIIGVVLIIPLMMVYGLVWDRQSQSNTAQNSIAAGWGGPQLITGPVMVIPYTVSNTETFAENGINKTRIVSTRKELFLSPVTNEITTRLNPERKKKSIYQSVLFVAANKGVARFAIPEDLARYGIAREALNLSKTELRFGISDARGLQNDSIVIANGARLALQPGKGLAASNGSGFFSFVDWSDARPLSVSYTFAIRGNKSMTVVPRGGATTWNVKSTWPSPSFSGDFLPTKRDITPSGFTSTHAVTNLALGQSLLRTDDLRPPRFGDADVASEDVTTAEQGQSQTATIGLIEPVDLYSQVDRSVKYGFLFIGFTFLAFLMFDIIAGAKVAAAEYLLTGAGLVLFFVMLLAFAEVIGFSAAYLVAASAITGLLTAYSAAILNSWLRARIIAALLAGLYGALYVLLSLEAYSLIIGSMLIFAALAVVMWATRSIDWSSSQPTTENS